MAATEILIVEDNSDKQLRIQSTLEGLGRKVFAVRTITEAFRLVSEQAWALIILDMTFQIDRSVGFESGRQAMAGIEVLQFLSRRRISVPVIVATQHSSFASAEIGEISGIKALNELLIEVFPQHYCGVVRVDQTEDWKKELFELAREILGKDLDENTHR